MSNYKITDVISNGTSNISWDGITPNIVIDKQNDTDTAEVTYNNDGTFTVSGKPKTITITYTQLVEMDQTYTNNAKVVDSSNAEKATAQSVKTIMDGLAVEKTGMPDYKKDNSVVGNKVEWSIKLTNTAGLSLNGAKISDEAIKTADDGSIKYYDVNGEVLSISPTVDKTNGTLTLPSSNVPSIVYVKYAKTIEGTTSRNSDNAVIIHETNTASAVKTSGDTPVTATGSVDYKTNFSVEKIADGFDSDAHAVKWKMTIRSVVTGNDFDYSKASLDSFVITDEAFTRQGFDVSKIGFNSYYQDAWNRTGMGTSVGEGNNTSNTVHYSFKYIFIIRYAYKAAETAVTI